MLFTSNFSFSHSVFKRLVLQTRINQGLFGKGLRKKKKHSHAQCFKEAYSVVKSRWLVVLGLNATLTPKAISCRSVNKHVFPGFLTPVLTQLSFQSHRLFFFTCFSRGERRKYTGKKVCLNRLLNSQPPGHESDTLTTEPPGRGW